MKRFSKRKNLTVVAVQINLKTEGLDYEKWGGIQHAKSGDWLVDNDGECYSIDQKSFAKTYVLVDENIPGIYYKTGNVWAREAQGDGRIETKEGTTQYKKGDWVVFNNDDGTDGYSMSDEKFQSLYEEVA